MSDDIYTFDKWTTEKIVRALRAQQLKIASLERNLAHVNSRSYAPTSPNRDKPVPFKNNSSETMPAYGIGRPTDVTKAGGDPYVQIEKPDDTFSSWYLVNSGNEVAADGTGWGYWLTTGGNVKYSTGTPAFGEEWGPTDDDWGLVKNRPGFFIQGAAHDTTNKIVRAIQREVTCVLGKTNDSHAKSASGDVSIWCGEAGSEEDTEWNISAYNRFAAVGSGKWVACEKIHGNWYLVAAEC